MGTKIENYKICNCGVNTIYSGKLLTVPPTAGDKMRHGEIHVPKTSNSEPNVNLLIFHKSNLYPPFIIHDVGVHPFGNEWQVVFDAVNTLDQSVPITNEVYCSFIIIEGINAS